MGTYYLFANLSRRERIEPGFVRNLPVKLGGIVHSPAAGLLALAMMTRWSGDHVVTVGDNGATFDRVGSLGGDLYDYDSVRFDFEDVTRAVVDDYNERLIEGEDPLVYEPPEDDDDESGGISVVYANEPRKESRLVFNAGSLTQEIAPLASATFQCRPPAYPARLTQVILLEAVAGQPTDPPGCVVNELRCDGRPNLLGPIPLRYFSPTAENSLAFPTAVQNQDYAIEIFNPTSEVRSVTCYAAFNVESVLPACSHGVLFDAEKARGCTSEEVRTAYPRGYFTEEHPCPLGCPYRGIAYASYEHYLAGDW